MPPAAGVIDGERLQLGSGLCLTEWGTPIGTEEDRVDVRLVVNDGLCGGEAIVPSGLTDGEHQDADRKADGAKVDPDRYSADAPSEGDCPKQQEHIDGEPRVPVDEKGGRDE